MFTSDLTSELEECAWFLEHDLREAADEGELRAAAEDDPEIAVANWSAVERLNGLANDVGELPRALLIEYDKARAFERELFPDGPDCIHCSMVMEIGFALHPRDIEDVCRIYIRAVDLARSDPGFPQTNMVDFWVEFSKAGQA